MPRIRQLSEKYAAEDFLREIRTRQGAADLMNAQALADASGVPYRTLLRRLKNPDDFTIGELRKLLKVIHIKPIEILRFLGYRKKDLLALDEEE